MKALKLFLLSLILTGICYAVSKKDQNTYIETINFTVKVIDSNTLQPLQLVTVILQQNNSIIASGTSNPFGRVFFNDIEEGIGNYLKQLLNCFAVR